MKKKNLKSLSLNKKSISNLDASQNKGGNANSILHCILTLDVGGVNICFKTQQKNCVSIFEPCITQTEHPTCRDCA